jgi:hypothetical protein
VGEGQHDSRALDRCPRCGADMPHPTEDDYQLAGTSMGGAWDPTLGGLSTGYWCARRCGSCGALLGGVEYTLYVPGQVAPVKRVVWTD